MEDIIGVFLRHKLKEMSDEAIDMFKSIVEEKTYYKGETLLDNGKINDNFYLVKTGLVASFIRNEDGSNFIRTIFKENNAIASLQSLISNKKSNASYECLVNSTVIEGKFSNFLKLADTDPIFHKLHIRILEGIYLDSEKRITELSSFDASQRYMQLKKEIPNIDNILPQYQIANYLNVTPVQLSRIRKKIFSK